MVDENHNNEMDITEFDEAIRMCYKELPKHEIDLLFQHFDKKGIGKITKEEFRLGLNDQMSLENKVHFYLHDFMTPLQTLMKRQNITKDVIFELFSKDKQHITLANLK